MFDWSVCCAFFAKVLSKITFSQLNHYFESNSLHSTFQSGLRAGHSCQTAIMFVSESIKRSIRLDKVGVAVLLDFQGAFPSVDHRILIKILESYGLNANAVNWFHSCLAGRLQILKYGLNATKGVYLVKEVIQGDRNSQLLFNATMNYLAAVITFC